MKGASKASKKGPTKDSESPPEVLAVAKNGDVFKLHKNGVLLTLAFGPRMHDRLKQALEKENSLAEFGPHKVGVNELYTRFFSQGLAHHEATFDRRKGKLKAKATGTAKPSKKKMQGVITLRERLVYFMGWVTRVQSVLASLEAGDPEPAKALARESIMKNQEMIKTIQKDMDKRAALLKEPDLGKTNAPIQ